MRTIDHDIAELLRTVVFPVANTEAFPELVAKNPCWNDVIESARLHGLLPMLCFRLQAVHDAAPPETLEVIRREFERNAFHCIANSAELLQVLNEFEQASISAMPFKGVVLAASAYADVTMRPAGDLDLLVYPHDLRNATAILLARGYELKTAIKSNGFPVHDESFELHFERPADGMVMELRWRLELTTPRFRRALGMEWTWAKRRTTQLAGAVVPNLDAVSALLVLCMHGSKHKWSRLIWVCDVARLIQSEPDLDWDAACREAKRVGLWRSLALGIQLAQRMAGTSLPDEVSGKCHADREAADLADFFAQHLVEHPGLTPEGRIPYNVRLLNTRDRVRFLLSPRFLKPNERDRAMMRLPKPLAPLYYLVRPLRVLLDRSPRQ